MHSSVVSSQFYDFSSLDNVSYKTNGSDFKNARSRKSEQCSHMEKT